MEVLDSEKQVLRLEFASKMDLLNSDNDGPDKATEINMTEEEQNKLLDISQEETLQIENDEDFSDEEKEDNENRGDKQNLPSVPISQDNNVKVRLKVLFSITFLTECFLDYVGRQD